mgnify:CR=1 FL=1
MKRPILSLLALGFTLAGCEPSHIGAYSAKERDYTPGKYAKLDPNAQPTRGSLFSDAVGGLLEDTRAVRVGDIVVIRIDEAADASGDSTTQLSREGGADLGISNVFGFLGALRAAFPEADPTHMLTFMSQADFHGTGNTSRKGSLKGSIAVRVVREMPNADLFLEGTKVIMINNEEYHMYVSGLVRRTDIEQDNTVASPTLISSYPAAATTPINSAKASWGSPWTRSTRYEAETARARRVPVALSARCSA